MAFVKWQRTHIFYMIHRQTSPYARNVGKNNKKTTFLTFQGLNRGLNLRSSNLKGIIIGTFLSGRENRISYIVWSPFIKCAFSQVNQMLIYETFS